MATVAPVIPPSVSPIPTPPSTTDPQNFDVRADTFLGSLPTNQSEMNALGNNVYDNALKTYNSAVDANTAANVAVPAADLANNSAIAAESAYDNMQKLYLGAKTSPPSTDNQGNPLQTGVWYTNTTSGYWYWWDGSSWLLGMSDLGSVSWLTQVTDKPTTLPGYGITDIAQARTDLGLKSAAVADILGPVSQSGGVPTGAIMQSGSNSNGGFLRFASGWQICTFTNTLPSQSIAQGVTINVGTWSYPAAFAFTPSVTAFQVDGYSARIMASVEGVGLNQINATYITSWYTDGARTFAPKISYMAVGRWF